jgi:E3 ubiquitin-protein ligase TRIP12
VGACLTYVDFFSMPAQRAALAVSANCCQGLGADDYHYVRDSIAMLSTRLTQLDKKALDSVCLLFARLVDSYQNDERVLREIAAHGLLPNVQTLVSCHLC